MQQPESLSVIFADISGSTRIIQRHGEPAARDIIKRCLKRVATAVTTHGGRVVNRIGDELMCTLPDVRQGIMATLEIQKQVRAGAKAEEYPADVRMHIGLHHGPVMVEGDQIFGDTIHVAKRMVDLAKPDQILATAGMLQDLGALPGIRWRPVDQIRIKGYDQAVSIFEIMREDVNMTLVSVSTAAPSTGEHYACCHLRYGTATYLLDPSTPVFTIGREIGSDLAILEGCVSREHGRLEYQKGRIIYVDHSTNGTFIQEADTPELVLVHREQRWLRHYGLLRFGRREDEARELTLEYRCELGPADKGSD